MSRKRRIFYTPTFNGLHNKVKMLVLLCLYDLWLVSPGQYVTPRRICELAPVSYPSMLTLLVKWWRWGLVGRRHTKGGFVYRIKKKAKRYLIKYKEHMPLEEYLNEIKAWRLNKGY